jgi:hypothetical protein
MSFRTRDLMVRLAQGQGGQGGQGDQDEDDQGAASACCPCGTTGTQPVSATCPTPECGEDDDEGKGKGKKQALGLLRQQLRQSLSEMEA